MDALVTMLRAAGDPTRLRLLRVLKEAELTVSELIEIVGQSQPRVSRHLKLLSEARLIERFKEGSWVFYRAADRGPGSELGAVICALTKEADHAEDLRRLAAVRDARAAEAAAFFKANADQWERIRALHAPDKDVEAAILRVVGASPIETLLDAGTGTGRMLELWAPLAKRCVGVDVSPEMLAIARDRIARAHLSHCQVRLADAYRLPFPAGTALNGFDTVLFHQVLHYLDDPGAAVAEAARVMRAGGRVVIADFAPHDLEFLRSDFAHRRLGFSDREVQSWFHAAGLKPAASESITSGAEKLTVKIWLAHTSARSRAEAA
ncbi:MAG TPA: metalloregulator ArsR/SmtB family transcription factor [Rhizomicrobium sp.]|jgi:ArsR family transcriptional regulator